MAIRCLSLLLAAHSTSALFSQFPTHGARRTAHRHAIRLTASPTIDPIDIQILQQQLQSVRELPRITDDAVEDDERQNTSCTEPSFRRLFTHATWKRYTGLPAHSRWLRTILSWRASRITRSILPCVAACFVWAFVVAALLPVLLPGVARRSANMWIPLSLQGTAIGLLLVFRTNNAYLRLAEAREQWGKLLMLVREITTKVSVALPYDVTCEACRYLCAFTWSLRDKLRDGDQRDDILLLLLGAEVSGWVSAQRSRPLAILSRLRRLLHAEYAAGALDSQVYYFLETDIKDIDTVVESCERLFSSPIPPNMARHGMRSLTLWILGLPIVMANTMPALIVALWTASTAFIYLGVEELGAQVEQPFAILPLWQLCHLAQLNVEEALATPDLPLRLNRPSKATPSPLSCKSGNPFGDPSDDDEAI